MELIDIALRGGAVALLFLLAALMWRAPIARDSRLSVVAVAVTESAFLLAHGPQADVLPVALAAQLSLLASAMPLAVTWLLLSIFLDPPMARWPWLTAAAIVAASLQVTTLTGASQIYCGFLSMILFAGLLVLALWSSREDLVDCRCKARPGFAAAIAGYGLLSTALQVLGGVDAATPWFAMVQSGGTLVLALIFAIWILSPDAARWPGPSAAVDAPVTALTQAPTGEDAALIARITAAMDAGIWREEGLTIGALASRLGVPEHRVRRAINVGLGHRNFSTFINRARIEAARNTLSDPDQMGRTVLEIAYEAGFSSLGPFNRAFRAETGKSPTEYRRSALEAVTGARAEIRNPAPISANLH
ncbi:helix-turn-helix domain-containing protein [Roseicyclus marinus]|uniref:helix-turn-helix domain-containing protein n=1 Tax=Roseicyclus marinus TaxID=2161673 RepID=UPI00240F0A24|nr:AraC family transcriptional regulator [Roseicyclus marinus]MDG3040552.1 AraC family transcriptional regulator [Roseicyclus marinus]